MLDCDLARLLKDQEAQLPLDFFCIDHTMES
jgi:hypothetical protein